MKILIIYQNILHQQNLLNWGTQLKDMGGLVLKVVDSFPQV
jgi:hypothetical protein